MAENQGPQATLSSLTQGQVIRLAHCVGTTHPRRQQEQLPMLGVMLPPTPSQHGARTALQPKPSPKGNPTKSESETVQKGQESGSQRVLCWRKRFAWERGVCVGQGRPGGGGGAQQGRPAGPRRRPGTPRWPPASSKKRPEKPREGGRRGQAQPARPPACPTARRRDAGPSPGAAGPEERPAPPPPHPHPHPPPSGRAAGRRPPPGRL